MNDTDWLSQRFEEHRTHLRAVAYRMLGSLSDAEDAVQEGWVRLSRSNADEIDNLGGWLTTVVARVCLNQLRSRRTRREDPLPIVETADGEGVDAAAAPRRGDPQQEALLADSVGLALLVVLEVLEPAERLAFVLHDLFAVPFDEIAPIVGRSPAAARQLASRARRRVRGADVQPNADRARQRAVVDAFLAASNGGDFQALVNVLDPDVVLRADRFALRGDGPRELHGAEVVASQARLYSERARFTRPALVNGNVGLVFAPRGRLMMVMALEFNEDRIAEMDIIADPVRLRELELAVIDS
jgi:RNA polymerase sigma-70 factor (ECF subfamily)